MHKKKKKKAKLKRGLIALAGGIQSGGTLTNLLAEHALPKPHTYATVEALVAAAARCAVLQSIPLGETDASVAVSTTMTI